MLKAVQLRHALTIAILFAAVHQSAVSAEKAADPCAAAPYGMTPAAFAFWKEGVVDEAKAIASIQEICRMKSRQASRKPLHELGISDEVIDRASPLGLMYQRMGALRFAAQFADEAGGARRSSPQSAKRAIRAEDIVISEQRFQRAVYNLSFNGSFGSELQMLGRLGVRFQDPQGHARDFGEVLADSAAALQRAVASGQMTGQEALYAAREAGFHGSVATAVANNDAGLAAAFKKAKAAR